MASTRPSNVPLRAFAPSRAYPSDRDAAPAPRPASRSDDTAWRCRCWITRIRRTGGFNQQDVRFFLCHRAVLRPFGHDKDLSRAESDVTITQPDRDPALQHQEE